MKLKILHLNVERDRHLAAVRALLEKRGPDVACFAEAMKADMERFSSEFGYRLAFAPLVGLRAGGNVDYMGSAILSRLPFKDVRIRRYDGNGLAEAPIHDYEEFLAPRDARPPDRFLFTNSLLSVTLENGAGTSLTIATTHFPVIDHGSKGLADHMIRDLQIVDDVERGRGYLDRLTSAIRDLPEPLVFTADLNNARGEFFYDSLSHALFDAVPESVSSTIDPVLHRAPALPLVVDTIMTGGDVNVSEFEVIEGVSDHKAFVAVLEAK